MVTGEVIERDEKKCLSGEDDAKGGTVCCSSGIDALKRTGRVANM